MILSLSILSLWLELITAFKETPSKNTIGIFQLDNIYSLILTLNYHRYLWGLELQEMSLDGTYHQKWIKKKDLSSKIQWSKFSTNSAFRVNITVWHLNIKIILINNKQMFLLKNISFSTTWQLIIIWLHQELLLIGHSVGEFGSVKTKPKWSGSVRKINSELSQLLKELILELWIFHFMNFYLRFKELE